MRERGGERKRQTDKQTDKHADRDSQRERPSANVRQNDKIPTCKNRCNLAITSEDYSIYASTGYSDAHITIYCNFSLVNLIVSFSEG